MHIHGKVLFPPMQCLLEAMALKKVVPNEFHPPIKSVQNNNKNVVKVTVVMTDISRVVDAEFGLSPRGGFWLLLSW